MLPILLTRRRTIVAALVFLAYGIACTQLPLFNTLGYEFSALTGIFVAIAAWPVLGRWLEQYGETLHPLSLFFPLTALLELLLVLPFAVLVANATFVKNCSLLAGALFYLLIPCLTAPAAAAFALFLGRFRRRLRPILYALAVLYLLILPFAQIFFHPQLYAYNHLFGLFVGFSWDESQPVFGTLALFRTITLAYICLFLSLAAIRFRSARIRATGSRRGIAAYALSAFSLAYLFFAFVFSDRLSFSTSASYVAWSLGEEARTKHFDIHYRATSFPRQEVEEMAEEHEFRLMQVTGALFASPAERIRSYIYPSRELKKRLLGTETSEISRPWLGEIHLSVEGWRGSLKHELVHAVAGEFAPYLFRAPVLHYLGLTEGLAMAVEWDYGNRTLHEYAASLRRYHLLPSVEAFLTTRGFLNNSSQLSYVASGSFCRWLIDTFGMEAMKRAYSRDDAALFGDLPLLEKEWHRFLDGLPRPAADSLATFYMFRGQSLFRKICPRVVSDLNRQGAAMRREGRIREALSFYEQSDAASPNPSAAFGRTLCRYLLGDYRGVLALTGSLFADTNRACSVAPLYLTRGDAAWMLGEREEATRCYTLLARENLYQSVTDDAQMRLEAMRDSRHESELRRILARRPLAAKEADTLERKNRNLLEEIVARDGDCLPARILLAESLTAEPDSARRVLALLSPAPAGTPFLRNILLMRGRAFLRMNDVAGAMEEYGKLYRAAGSEAEREDARDRIERCRWKLSLTRPVLDDK